MDGDVPVGVPVDGVPADTGALPDAMAAATAALSCVGPGFCKEVVLQYHAPFR